MKALMIETNFIVDGKVVGGGKVETTVEEIEANLDTFEDLITVRLRQLDRAMTRLVHVEGDPLRIAVGLPAYPKVTP